MAQQGDGAVTGSDWNELENLLAELLERPASERNAFLDQTFAGRPALRQELTELLKAHERDSLLDSPAATLLEERHRECHRAAARYRSSPRCADRRARRAARLPSEAAVAERRSRRGSSARDAI